MTTLIAEKASRYGVVQVDEDGRVTRFDYKPEHPEGNLVTTEVFLYKTEALLDALDLLKERDGELGDYGEQLVPWFVEHKKVVEHRHDGYWLDLGTIQSYWTANLQLLDGDGATLDDPTWRIYSALHQLPPARVVDTAEVRNAMLSSGCRVEGTVIHSVIGAGVTVHEGATVTDSVVLDGATIGPGVSLINCIVSIGAEVTGGSIRGSAEHVTLIGPDGLVDEREPLDQEAELPRGFKEKASDEAELPEA